ncbi:MAG: hypothetical protein IJN70_07820 [Clostridia bacterium]|nr:hypothetical protein [Clostridia bacterium]
MGKTKKSQFLLGLLIGISVWTAGVVMTGFLPIAGIVAKKLTEKRRAEF